MKEVMKGSLIEIAAFFIGGGFSISIGIASQILPGYLSLIACAGGIILLAMGITEHGTWLSKLPYQGGLRTQGLRTQQLLFFGASVGSDLCLIVGGGLIGCLMGPFSTKNPHLAFYLCILSIVMIYLGTRLQEVWGKILEDES